MLGYIKRLGSAPVKTDVSARLEAMFPDKTDIGVYKLGKNSLLYSKSAHKAREDKNFELKSRDEDIILETFFGPVAFVGSPTEDSYNDYEGVLPSFVTHLYVEEV